MGLGKAFTRSAENGMPHAGPPYPTYGYGRFGELGNLLGSTGGKPWEVSGATGLQHYRGAMRIPAGWRAAIFLAELLAGVPLDAYTTHGKDQATLIDPRPALLEQPSPPDTRFTTLSSAMLDKVWHGNAVFIIATRDSYGTPTSVWPVSADGVGVRRITPENMQTTLLPVGAVEYQIGARKYDSSEIIHVKGPCAPGALRGFGVLEAHFFGVLATAHEQQREAQVNTRPGIPSGILKVTTDEIQNPGTPYEYDPNDPDNMQAMRRQWMRNREDGGVAVMNSVTDFEALSWNPTDRQMIEGRQFTLLEMALIFGLPPSFLGASSGDSMTYSTEETKSRDLLKFSMRGHFTQFEQTLSLVFPRNTNVKADLDDFLQGDTLQRFQAYSLAIQSGWFQRSEARIKEKLHPIAGIDAAPETDFVQLKLKKDEPPAKPVTALPAGPGQDPAMRAIAERMDQLRSHSFLPDTPQGKQLWDYWLYGEGSKWKLSPHPWTALNDALKLHAVAKGDLPAHAVNGLTTNLLIAAGFDITGTPGKVGGRHRG
jgi:HK97 family phage portal protein